MKKIILFSISVLLNVFTLAQKADYSNYNQSTGIRVFAGYNSFDLSEAKKNFRNEIKSFNSLNINVKEQTLYPANSLLGFGIYYFPAKEIELNLNTEFTSTKAISLYGDQFGEIDIKSEIELFSVELGMKKYFMDVNPVQPYIALCFGLVNGKYKITESTKFFQNLKYNRNSFADFTKLGYKAELNFGLSYNVWVVLIDMDAGYRYLVIPKPEREDFNGYNYIEPFELNSSGFVFKIGLRTGIYW